MRLGGKRWAITMAVLAVALALRLGAACWWQARLDGPRRFAFGDSESYWSLARAIAHGRPYEYGEGMRMFRMPGYPLVLAGLFATVGDDPSVMWARGLGAVLGTLTVACVMFLARQLFAERTALMAGVLAACYPGAISISVFVLSEVLFCPLMLLQLICWIAAARAASRRARVALASLAGVVGGCATLVRPSWLLFTPGAVALFAVCDRRRGGRTAGGVAMLALLALTLAPWWVRGYRLTGHFVPTTLQVGASLYDGWNPAAAGGSDMRFVTEFLVAQRADDARHSGALSSTFEYRVDRRLRRAAVTWASAHPARVCELAWVKFLRMWSPWPNAADMQSWTFRLAVLLGYTPLAVLGGWGFARNWRRDHLCWLCLLPAVYFTCLHVVFVSSIRYREPAMLPWIVLAAAAATGWRQDLSENVSSA